MSPRAQNPGVMFVDVETMNGIRQNLSHIFRDSNGSAKTNFTTQLAEQLFIIGILGTLFYTETSFMKEKLSSSDSYFI